MQEYLERYHHRLRQYWTIKLIEPGSVLDIGCGIGVLISKITNKIKVGVDINFNYINYARIDQGENKFLVGNVINLPFSDKTFDNVICSEVLEHLVNPKRAIKEIIRVAKKNIIVSIPTYNSIFCIRKLYRTSEHVQNYSLKRILKEIEEEGVKVKNIIGTRFITIPAFIANKLQRILFPIDKFLNSKPFFNTHGFHTIIRLEKI
jgi:ubiquinone/menaquinone biosynthesis C-methylase UbiE